MTQQKQKQLGRARRPLLRCAALLENSRTVCLAIAKHLKKRVQERRRGEDMGSSQQDNTTRGLRYVALRGQRLLEMERPRRGTEGRATKRSGQWTIGEKRREGRRMSTTTQDRTRKEIEPNGLDWIGLEQNEDTDAT